MAMVHSIRLFFMLFMIVTMKDIFVQNSHANVNEENVCRRTCEVGMPPMLCVYSFDVERYYTLSQECRDCPYNVTDCFAVGCIPGDGTERRIVTINRKLPGPSIEVCQNDIVIVTVKNKMDSDSTTIHWHGQKQKACPYMDGVPYVTQCPIQPSNSFRYTFEASQAGTHFWHSHVGMQRVDGAFGPLIVRVPKEEDYHGQIYDFDLSSHIMVINDWGLEVGEKMLMSHFHSGGAQIPISLLINGLGRHRKFDELDGKNKVFVPTARFKVNKGYRYRFRVINSGALNCPIEITVDDHIMLIINSDGLDTKPINATSLITYAGERFDFILNANQEENLYWIKFKGLVHCNEKHGSVFQVAVLEYNGAIVPPNSYPAGTVSYSNAHNEGIQVNPLNVGSETKDTNVPLVRMQAVDEWDRSLQPVADFQYFIGFDFNNISYNNFGRSSFGEIEQKLMMPQFNHISMLFLPSPLLSQRDELDDEIFCSNETVQENNCKEFRCDCLHGIKVPLDAVVELFFIDEGHFTEGSHPIHLHGYDFRVVAMERMGTMINVEDVKEKDAKGLIFRNLINAPIKDTVTVPDGGYTIVRFVAGNPGFWILHCHIEVHMALGMAMILQVGEKDEMVPVPRNFPKCGQHLPNQENLTDFQENAVGQIEAKWLHIVLSIILLVINNLIKNFM